MSASDTNSKRRYIDSRDPWDDNQDDSFDVIVTDFEVLMCGKWASNLFRACPKRKAGLPDNRTKKGKLIKRYIRRVLKLSEQRFIQGLITNA